jgi:hypothetical protein
LDRGRRSWALLFGLEVYVWDLDRGNRKPDGHRLLLAVVERTSGPLPLPSETPPLRDPERCQYDEMPRAHRRIYR